MYSMYIYYRSSCLLNRQICPPADAAKDCVLVTKVHVTQVVRIERNENARLIVCVCK